MLHRVSCTPILIVSCLIVGVYVVKIANLLNVDFEDLSNDTNDSLGREGDVDQDDQTAVKGKFGSSKNFNSEPIGDSLDHLMWFMQISDLHISYFTDSGRIENLKEFCLINVRVIKPSVVLASGDLTDGRTVDTYGSRQFEEEWRLYKDAITTTGVLGLTTWLDLRGNHDNFDVISVNSTENFFRKYSVQGAAHPRSYLYQHKVGFDTYSFIAVDACLEPGPRRPFNFIGLLTEKEMRTLQTLEAETRESNATIWFGHYPTSSMYSPYPGIRHLMRHGLAYLCGHFHTLGGWVRNMYTLQKSGVLELELGDWKDSRLYRIAAIDHGLFSFVDVKHTEWPVILITNPKHVLFTIPNQEPISRVLSSSHIRILAFSPSPITKVAAKIDDGEWQLCKNTKGPLYVLPWKPHSLASGLHEVTVQVEDQSGKKKVVSQPFSVDGTRMSFDLLPRMLLMSTLSISAQIILSLSLLVNVLPLCWIRVMHHYVKVGKLARPRYTWGCVRSFMRMMWLVATVDRIFYPLVIMAVYVPIGPWFVGYIIDNHVSICFAWGMFVNGTFIPGGFTFFYAVVHLWTFNFPLMFLLARCLDVRYCHLRVVVPPSSFPIYIFRHLPIFLLLMFNAFMAYLTIPTYGKMAFFLNPIKTWSLIAAVVLWQLAIYTPEYSLQHLVPIFPHVRPHLTPGAASIPLRQRRDSKDDT